MSQIAQQIVTPTFVDPNNVSETYANGPINFNIMGPCATLTFTAIRGDLTQSMKVETVTKANAVVVARITLPLQMAAELKGLLNRSIQEQPISTGSSLKQ